ncbi:MAG: DUF2470 domain-containing protein [Nocardioides sp.]|uniref:DUF2470 domain-containing protein n=1 Tax=Nocardioides sp. TaxID=35761 RepID=UPI003F12B32E
MTSSWLPTRSDRETASAASRAAEMARTVLARSTALRLAVPGAQCEVVRHAVAPDGTVLLVPGSDERSGRPVLVPGQPARTVGLTVTDLTPTAVPDRVRGVVEIVGKAGMVEGGLPAGARAHLLGPDEIDLHRGIWIVAPRRVTLRGAAAEEVFGTPTREVDRDAFRSAVVDPLLPIEKEWLAHLDHGHPEVLAALACQVRPDLPASRVRPVALDRRGLVVRHVDSGGDVRIEFPGPVVCGCDLAEAFATLLESIPGGPRLDCAD